MTLSHPEEILAEAPDGRDVAAELAAPPRRRLPWLPLLLVAGTIAGAAFAGGASYEKGNGSATAGFPTGASRGTGTGTAGGTAANTPTSGTVKLIDGSTVYLTTTSGGVVKVTTKGSTKITTAQTGKTTDLKPGDTVTVQGSTDSSGNVAATTVTEGG